MKKMSLDNVFRAYDLRGIYQKEISEDFALGMGLSFGTYLRQKDKVPEGAKVVLGTDARHGGPELEAALAKGLRKCGLDTISIGMAPTPVVNYWCEKKSACAGVIISASHNPPEYNGIRFRKGDGEGYPECIPELKAIWEKSAFIEQAKEGTHLEIDAETVKEEYLDEIISKTNLQKPLKVVVDPGNGAACGYCIPLFASIGCSVTTINDTPDGDFPGRSANPTEETLKGLSGEVIKMGADIGVAYDGDADRAVFVDNKGRVASAEEVGALMVREILAEEKGEVALNVDCSMSVEEAAKAEGGTVRRIRVGDVFLAKAVKDGAVFAMESSSHFVVPKYFHFDDGIAVSAFMAQIVSELRGTFAENLEGVPKYPVKRKKLTVTDEKKFGVIDALAKLSSDRKPLTIDGVKVNYENGWTLARASNTQPMIRITAEGKTEKDADELMARLEEEIASCI